VVALEVSGSSMSTSELSVWLNAKLRQAKPVALLIGGPNGLSPACLERAEERWSLSPLTLPHALVRILVAEQLYRAMSFAAGHPYHRA
jgi:23S rRNA (pseudouridine1915-N3)-methyltransferase